MIVYVADAVGLSVIPVLKAFAFSVVVDESVAPQSGEDRVGSLPFVVQ
jgi:hypothetical protein